MKHNIQSLLQQKTVILCTAFLLFFISALTAQNNTEKRADFLITAGSVGTLNNHEKSAPSPITFSFGAGSQIRLLEKMSITPHAQFFAGYYRWEDNQVLPATIEHRSAYIPSIMLDIPVTYDMRSGNSIFRVGGGVSFLFRYAFLAINVPASVQGDIDFMNEWFWQEAEFFYPSLQFSWDYHFEDSTSIGLGAKVYLPMGSLIKGNGINNGIAHIGVRLGL